MHAATPNKTSGEVSARAGSTAPSPIPAAEAEPGTYAAIATPYEGGSHHILTPTPSISGDPSAPLGSDFGEMPAASHRPAALQTAEAAHRVKLQDMLCLAYNLHKGCVKFAYSWFLCCASGCSCSAKQVGWQLSPL